MMLTNKIKPRVCMKSIFVTVTLEYRVKRVINKLELEHWQTVQAQIRRSRTWRPIRVCTDCLNHRTLSVK